MNSTVKVPRFLRKTAVTGELYDFVTELRLGDASCGLEEHINRESRLF